MEWNKFYYNGYNTNIEVNTLGQVRRVKVDWSNGYKIGIVDLDSLKDDGYYYRIKVLIEGLGRKTIKIHQIVASVYLDYKFQGYKNVVDHIDGNHKNNNISNLRVISHRDNTSKERTLKSGLPVGVVNRKDSKKYQAQIRVGNKRKYLGLFDTAEQASNAYKNELDKWMRNKILNK